MALQRTSTRREPQAREPRTANALPGVPGNAMARVDRARPRTAQTHGTSTSAANEAGANLEKKIKVGLPSSREAKALCRQVTGTLNCPDSAGSAETRIQEEHVHLAKAGSLWTSLSAFSRKNYLYSVQSETQGMWKQGVGGTHHFLAHKGRFYWTERLRESGCSSVVGTLEGSTAQLFVTQTYKGGRICVINTNIPSLQATWDNTGFFSMP